ncbi:oligosaccharyl transferase, archaeosortase A system-associated [Methanoculleus oceani]|uniref:dolichyl-phosphooligosaccharide-protein glycotransferase n=1 Tax=Methanoculleus oceani TaxID=2184756 RepID=A0ABD4TA27_9EURY|nr:oligosaccharyl transferase, archaeosortase A system-associated [Methanoculleus sp. CWC-02]MCM2465213.1 oligosaccharyl transferase, archaeosortase A system-associated [Methanoculleus sp. CWC-02]
MAPAALKEHKTALTAAVLLLFMIVAVLLRAIPHAALVDGSFTSLIGTDAWYNLRQVEMIAANYPGYAWFDPMTAYPTGKEVAWGPLFPLITATLCLLAGAATRPEIVYTAAWVPPLLAAAVVPGVYLTGKTLADRTTGLAAAGLITIVSASFFARSIFGFVDHHVAETLFSTLFCLAYIAALAYAARHPVTLAETKTILPVALLALGAGAAYLLGLLVMPTMILFALIAGVFTVLQAVRNHLDGTGPEGLLLVNAVAFVVPTIFLPLSGFMVDSQNLSLYSVGHVYAYLLLIAATALLSGISLVLKGRRNEYLAALAALGITGVAFLGLTDIGRTMAGGLITFFGRDMSATAIREMAPWDASLAWQSFNVGLLLIPAGLVLLALRARRENRPELLFAIVWSVIILIATIQHLRFEYYLAVNLALLAGVVIAWALGYGFSKTAAFLREPESKKKKKTLPTAEVAAVGIAVLLIMALVGASASENIGYAVNGVPRTILADDWRDALEWMNAHTPGPGVDYYAIFEKNGFTYPEESYGVMSWWDYGHWITFIAQRIPNTNPFQDHVPRATGFFLATAEEKADVALAAAGSRYIVTDGRMAAEGFPAIAYWHNATAGTAPYATALLVPVPGRENAYSIESFYKEAYFETMAVRLQVLDGTMTEPEKALYVEYDTASVPETGYARLTASREMNPAGAQAVADAYTGPGKAAVFGTDAATPPGTLPALKHYRLVYESSPDAETSVKVFEFVDGAVIPGEGVIEVTVVTNTGREFLYRQQSENGTFVVPYSTTGNPYDVKTAGNYRIGNEEFTATEEAVTGRA